MPYDQIGIAEKTRDGVVLTLRAEAPDGSALGDAEIRYLSIADARAAGWNIPGTPTKAKSVPVLAVD